MGGPDARVLVQPSIHLAQEIHLSTRTEVRAHKGMGHAARRGV